VHHLDVGVDDLLDKGKCQDQVKEPRVSDLVCTVVEQGSHGGAIRVDSIVSEHPKGGTGNPNEVNHHKEILHVLVPNMEYPEKERDQVPIENLSSGNQEQMGDPVTLQQ
jgi:hypothetical protein